MLGGLLGVAARARRRWVVRHPLVVEVLIKANMLRLQERYYRAFKLSKAAMEPVAFIVLFSALCSCLVG